MPALTPSPALGFARRVLGLDVAPDHTSKLLHFDEAPASGLNDAEARQLRWIRLMGATGAIMMALGALGVGAQPVLQNPTQGLRMLGLFARVLTSSLAMTIIGTALVVLAWLLLGRFAIASPRSGRHRHRLSRAQIHRTMLLWVLPLAVAPPMFSRDVYSYLAQSEIAARGIDPYVLGPGPALGIDHVLTRTIPNIWRDTPAPYGPLFLWLGRGIADLTGYNIVAGVLCHRALALAGVALIVWAIPRLARRCGVPGVSALWLGVANPLVMFHLVAGVHNEALMLGLMLVGVELAIDATANNRPLERAAWAKFVAGCALIALGAMVKIPALIAMGFVGMALARRLGGVRGFAIAVALTSVIATVIAIAICELSGLGWGWLGTLGTANAVRSWMSLPTAIGIITGFSGVLLGLGDHTTAILNISRPLAGVVIAYLIARMLLAVYTGRIALVGALGLAFGAAVLLSPVVQPWYLLWSVIPLAAWANRALFRVPTIVYSVIISLILMPGGRDILPLTIAQAAAVAIAVCCGFIYLTRDALPWRTETAPAADPVEEPAVTTT